MFFSDANGGYRAPRLGELFKNPSLAKVFESIADGGSDAFYKGWIADAIVKAVQSMGGVLTLDDLAQHRYLLVGPISVEYKGSCRIVDLLHSAEAWFCETTLGKKTAARASIFKICYRVVLKC